MNNSVKGRGLSGNGGGVTLDEKVPRKFNITFVAIALNVFNVVNYAPPNGVMESPLFSKTQSLADEPYSGPTPGTGPFCLLPTSHFDDRTPFANQVVGMRKMSGIGHDRS